ncbi:hypothetical protein ACFE04_029722 [Oxalis oulophora]
MKFESSKSSSSSSSSSSSYSVRELNDSSEEFHSTVRDNDLIIYEKAVNILHQETKIPLTSLAKLGVWNEHDLFKNYGITSHPQIKVFMDRGKTVHLYHGPNDTNALLHFFIKLTQPFPLQLLHPLKLEQLQQKPVIVGVFPTYSGLEFDNFIKVAHKLRWSYTVFLTSIITYLNVDRETTANQLPFSKKPPVVHVFTPSIYGVPPAETSTFDVDALVDFIEQSTTPLVTIYNSDPQLDAAFFSSRIEYDKAMLFIDFNHHDFRVFEKTYCEVAQRERDISFMLADSAVLEHDFLVFELHKSPTPLIVIRTPTGETYVKAGLTPDDIETWVGDCKVRKVTEYGILGQEKKDGHVMMVSSDNFQEEVMDSGKNFLVMLGYWCHWCDRCKELARVLDNVAIYSEKGVDVVIAKLVYKNARDVRRKHLHDSLVDGDYPTLCFKRATGYSHLYLYHGLIKEDNIIQFIYNNLKYKPETKLVGHGEKILILDHMSRDVARTIYNECEMGKKFDIRTCSRFSSISIGENDFEETMMDPRLNVLLILYGSTWISDHGEFGRALRKLAHEFEKEKEKEGMPQMRSEFVIVIMDKYVADTYYTVPKALIQVMHCFKTFTLKAEPTIFFKTASGKLVVYDCDDMSVESMRTFIWEHMEVDINRESKAYKTLAELSSQEDESLKF